MDKNLIPKKKINVKKILEFVGVTTIIMSVIGLGIYFFIKEIITPPDICGDQGKLTCKSNNACIDTNMCDYSTAEYTLQYDPDSCSCNIICNDPNAKGINNDGSGSSTITMKKQDDGSYIPDGDIICGIDCPEATSQDFSDQTGGPGYCKSDYLCGTLTYENGGGHGIYENKHCFSKNSFLQCSSGIQSICLRNEGCTDDGYCKETPCSGTEEINGSEYEYVYACQSDYECGVSGAKCKTDDGKFKYFNNRGYCVNKDGGIANSNKGKKNDIQCGHKQFFGQDKDNNFVNCQQYNDKTTGVYANNQCDESGIFLKNNAPKNTCAIYGICSNNWQALDPSGNVSCSASPVPDTSSYNCCNDDMKAKSKTGDKFCCPKKTHDNGKCLNTTKYRYSKAALNSIGEPNPTIAAAEGIPCHHDSDCEDSRQKLWNLLKNKGNYPDSWSESQGEPNSINKYVNMYCEKDGPDSGFCKAECGLFDGTSQINNNYNVANINFNGVNNPYSFCYYKDNEKCELDPTAFHYQTDAGTPICQKNNFPDAWSRPYGDGYSTLYAGSFPLYQCNNNNQKQNACLETMNSFKNVHTISMNDSSCKADLACDQLEVTTFIGTDKPEPKSLNWTDLNKNYSIEEINNPNFRVNQTSNSTPDKVTGLIYRYNPSKKCLGNIPTGYDKDSTKSPFDGASSLGECSPDLAKRHKLTMTSGGFWNPNGTELLYGNPITSNFQDVNFGNDNEYFGNINENYDPTKFIGKIDTQNPSTAYIKGNTSKDNYNYWCSAFQLIGDNNFHNFQKLEKSKNGNPYLKCEDTNDGGVIRCIDDQRNPVRCCEDSSSSISPDVKINVTGKKNNLESTGLWKCAGFPSQGSKTYYCDAHYNCMECKQGQTTAPPEATSGPNCFGSDNCQNYCFGLKRDNLFKNKFSQFPNPNDDNLAFAKYFYSNIHNWKISFGLAGPVPIKGCCDHILKDSCPNKIHDFNNIFYDENCILKLSDFYYNYNVNQTTVSDQNIKFDTTNKYVSESECEMNGKKFSVNKYKKLCFSDDDNRKNEVYWLNDGNNYSKFNINIVDLGNNKNGFTILNLDGNKSLLWSTDNDDPICQCKDWTDPILKPSTRGDKYCNIFAFQYDQSSDLTYIIGLNPEKLDGNNPYYKKIDKSPNNLFYTMTDDAITKNLILSFIPYGWVLSSEGDWYVTGIRMRNLSELRDGTDGNGEDVGPSGSYTTCKDKINWSFYQPMSETTCCAMQIEN